MLRNSTAHELVIQQQADKGRVVQPSPKGKAAKSPQNDGQRDRPERATKPNRTARDPVRCLLDTDFHVARNRTLPLDPPAVLEYICHDDDPKATWMDSPNIFCTVDIVPCDLDTAQLMTEDTMDILVGSRVVSLQHVTRGSKDSE